MKPAEIPLTVISLKRIEFGDIEKSRCTVEVLEIVLFWYSVYHEDELR
jgi:hypothetical protein